MSQDQDDVYNNSHRAFLQSFLSRATLTLEQARPIIAAIENAQGSDAAPIVYLVFTVLILFFQDKMTATFNLPI
jgi:hypothetical protein